MPIQIGTALLERWQEPVDNGKNMNLIKHQDYDINPREMKQNRGSMDHDMQKMKGMQMQNSPHNMNNVSWFSQEEDQKEPHGEENNNWMQSKSEDSMGGHMHGGQMKNMIPNMQVMSHDIDMPDMNENQLQQYLGH
jgi:hypothetical protein